MEPNQNPNPNINPTPAGTDPMVAQGAAVATATPQPTAPAQQQVAQAQAMAAAQPVASVATMAQPAPAAQNPAMDANMDDKTMEQQMEALLSEPAPAADSIVEPTPAEKGGKKKPNVMMIGLICAIAVAVVGIGFGVFSMISGNSTADSLNKQIATLKKQNSDLNAQVAAVENALTGEEALTLLNEAATTQNMNYGFSYANAYEIETTDEDEDADTTYLVRFLMVSNGASNSGETNFVMNEDGEWEFTLPQPVAPAPVENPDEGQGENPEGE